MNASAWGTAAALPAHLLLVLGAGLAALVLIVYLGVVLPAVWSARPARRKAAAAVLRQILDAWTNCRRR